MAFDFPAPATDGQKSPDGRYVWSDATGAWEPAPTAAPSFSVPDATPTVKGIATLPPDGSTTVKGLLQLADAAAVAAGTPGLAVDVEQALKTFLSLAGGTMLGDLLLKGNPTAGLMAATRAYVDERTVWANKGVNSPAFTSQTIQFNIPGLPVNATTKPFQMSFMRLGPTTVNGQIVSSFDVLFDSKPYVWASIEKDAYNQAAVSVASPIQITPSGCSFEVLYTTGAAVAPFPNAFVHALAIGFAAAPLPRQ